MPLQNLWQGEPRKTEQETTDLVQLIADTLHALAQKNESTIQSLEKADILQPDSSKKATIDLLKIESNNAPEAAPPFRAVDIEGMKKTDDVAHSKIESSVHSESEDEEDEKKQL